MLTLYKILSFCLYPILPLVLLIRQSQGKEDEIRKREKLAKIIAKRPSGKLIWIHGASVGESNSVLPLIRELLNRDKNLHILMTTGTLSSANLLAKKLPERAFHQFVPLDAPQIVRKFLNYWKPNSVFWLESEIWPNIMLEIKKRNIPCVALNSIMSERSFNRWSKHKDIIKEILSCFKLVLAQEEGKAKFFKKLGAKNVKCVGNLKFTVPAPAVNEMKLESLQESIGKRKLMCFSSTHAGEEELAINSHQVAKEKYKNLLTIIIPRHPSRKDEIKGALEKSNLNFAFRSDGFVPDKNMDIYVADTFGEVGTFYSLCPIVFMGGSLSPYHDGGHNPIEPAQFGCVVISGDKISCFRDIFAELAKSCIIVDNEKDLQKNILDLFEDSKKVKAMSKEALKVAGKDNKVLSNIMEELTKAKVI